MTRSEVETSPLTPGQHKYYGRIVDRLAKLKNASCWILQHAAKEKKTLDWILEQRREFIFHSENYKKLPEKYQQQVNAYFEGCLDMHRSTALEYVLYYDGKYIGESHRENKATEEMYKQPNFKGSLVSGKMVYIGTEIEYNPD